MNNNKYNNKNIGPLMLIGDWENLKKKRRTKKKAKIAAT